MAGLTHLADHNVRTKQFLLFLLGVSPSLPLATGPTAAEAAAPIRFGENAPATFHGRGAQMELLTLELSTVQ